MYSLHAVYCNENAVKIYNKTHTLSHSVTSNVICPSFSSHQVNCHKSWILFSLFKALFTEAVNLILERWCVIQRLGLLLQAGRMLWVILSLRAFWLGSSVYAKYVRPKKKIKDWRHGVDLVVSFSQQQWFSSQHTDGKHWTVQWWLIFKNNRQDHTKRNTFAVSS